ncbi:MAG: peptidyl-prolyl cis-trans isomerase [Candidatus Omnitrophica bacterium]|nr:peptidyl-prolyl cis-trans isomerase [Candidatus Omnitrophota bacterium]
MIKLFRHKGVTKKILWVVASLIIISFVFGGLALRYGSAFSLSQSAGKAFGRNISLQEFQKNYRDVRDQAIMMHGADAEKYMPMMDMDSETWTRIILLKAAQERNIKVTDMEVVQYIGSIPFFLRNGQFDKRLYANIVENVFHREARDFEEGLRNQIKIMKIFAPALKKINITGEMVRQKYERRNQKVQVNYLLLSPDSFTGSINPSDKELMDFFDGQRDSFLEPEAVNASIITVALSAKASNEEKTKAAAAADAIFQKLNEGADLAATAQTYNAAIKDTGFFNIDTPNTDLSWSFELLQQVFTAKTGDILKPVESPSGYQIVKVAEKKVAFIPEFTAVKDKVKAAYIKNKATAAAAAKANELQKILAGKIKEGVSFTAAAGELKLNVKQTDFFGMGEYVQEIGLSDDFTSAAFKLNKDNPLSDVVVTSRGPAILHWVATQPIDAKKFEAVKKEFENSLFAEERVKVMNDTLRTLRENAKLENYLNKINASQKKAMDKMRVR